MQFLSLVFKDSKFSVYIRDDADESVMAEIFKHHEYRAVENIIKETAETIVDVGAHAGFFILYARVLNKKAPILAIEPEKENLSVLNRHIKENKIHKVKIIEGALAEKTGQGNLLISKDNHNHRLVDVAPPDAAVLPVTTFSLSDILTKIKSIGLLKMDIE